MIDLRVLFVGLLMFLSIGIQQGFAQRVTNQAGNWNTTTNWSPNGTPANNETVTINHPMNINANVQINSGGVYTFNANSSGTQALNMDSGTGILIINADVTFGGGNNINGGTIIVRSGYTLTVGNISSLNATIIVEPDATFIINGSVTNNGSLFVADGLIQINGTYQGSNSNAHVEGNGDITTTGSMVTMNGGSIFGVTNVNCSGPCSGRGLVGCLNVSVTPTSISGCIGFTQVLTANATGGTGNPLTYRYRWQQRTSAQSNYSNISGATNATYVATATATLTYYRVYVEVTSNNQCNRYSNTINVLGSIQTSAPTAGSNSPVNSAGVINLTASTISGASYSWTGPDGFTSTTQNPSISNASVTMSGVYSVTATVNGCTSTAGTVTVTVLPPPPPPTFNWTGAVNTDWNTTGNWSSNIVPNSTREVNIFSGSPRYPVITGATPEVNSIYIESGASVSLSSGGALTIYESLTNEGTITADINSTVVFSGSFSGNVEGTMTLGNLTIDKSSGANVTLQDDILVTGAITLTQGALVSNGHLTLNLDNGYINKGGAGSITGNMTVTRTVSSIRTHYFSVPLDGATVADLTDDVSVFNTVNGVSRLFQYSESTNAWTRITSGTAPLIKGIGYSLYFTTPTVLDITGTYDHSYVHNVTFTNTANAWKFVGNPYPSTIDWDAASGWTKTNLNNAVNYWEGSSGQYISYVSGVGTTAGGKTADQYIPAMNGFWVQTTGTGGASSTLNMTSNVRSSVPMTLYRDIDMSNIYSLNLSNGTSTDEAIIRFNDSADPSFEPMVDSKKINNTGTIPSVASTMVGTTMSINTMPVPTVETEIPLYVKVPSNGNYTLNWSNKSNPLYGAQLYLYDKKLGTSTVIVEDESYNITQTTTDSTNRYVLKLVPATPIVPTIPTTPPQSLTTGTQNALQASVRVYAKEGKVYVEGVGSGSKEIEGEIITIGGTSLDHFSGVIGEGVAVSRTLTQVSSAVYLVRITSEGQQATYRVVMY
ncbi:MAG: hypothetical protein U0U66_07950 [Cytophagaceae bacterium]